jgi:hypothetical protein
MIRRLLAPSARFVLAIGNEGGLLLHLAAGRISGRWQVAGHDDAALAALAAPLAARPKCPLVVVGDLLEQSYRKEAVPRLNRFDRAKVLARRLERAFLETPLKAALKLADDPEEPRSQNFLLVGIPPSADWDRWIGFLRSIENPVLALSLLPIEAAGMVTCLVRALTPAGRPPHSWAILISRQRTGGFRQIVVDRGELVLTRLTPSLAADAGPAGVAAEIRLELKATLGYMTRLGYRAGGSLDIVVLGDDELRARLADGGSLPGQLAVVSAAQAAKILGIGALGRADDVDGALLAAVWVGARRRPTLQLLPRDLRARNAQGQALRWATAGLAASALGLISYSALSAVSALEIEQEIGWLSAWQSTTRQQLARSESETLSIGGQADAMRLLLQAHQRLQAQRDKPVAALAALRRAMTPDEQLLAMAWQLVEPADERRPESEAADFALDLTLDLGLASEPATAVAATEDLARRLAAAIPARPVAIIRQAVDILPHQAFVGGSGPADPAADPETRLSAELRIGTRAP